MIFYSAHNLLEKLAGKEKTVFNELTIYVSINQSIDAIQRKDIISTDKIKTILKNSDKVEYGQTDDEKQKH